MLKTFSNPQPQRGNARVDPQTTQRERPRPGHAHALGGGLAVLIGLGLSSPAAAQETGVAWNVAASFDYVILAVLIGLAGLECAAFLLFAHDKGAAREHRRRIPERTLLWAALWGGVGAWLACRTLRHKTRKEPFRTSLWVIVGVQIAALAFVAYRLSR